MDLRRAHNRADTPTGLELVISKALDPVQVFTSNGLDPILERIEKETHSVVLDISTKKGREQIASLAHKIAKSKTALDSAGKELVSGWKQQAKLVDVERARAWERLEALQKEVRQPLTDWENAEKERVVEHEAALTEMSQLIALDGDTTPAEIERRITRLIDLGKSRSWEEFAARARNIHYEAYDILLKKLSASKAREAEQAELARLRKEDEDRKQREHEERLKAEAAEKARIEAEEKARLKAEVEAKRVAAEKARAEQERLRIQWEKEEAEARAASAEAGRIAAEQQAVRDKELADQRAAKAESDRIVAEKKAKEDARIAAEKAAQEKKAAEEAAATRERQRIEAEKRAEVEATAKREADKSHKAKINREALHVLKNLTDEQTAKAIIEAIALGHIPHIAISY